MLKIENEEFLNVSRLNDKMLNDYIHQMADQSLPTRKFRSLWNVILEKLIDIYFNLQNLQFEYYEHSISVILRAGTAGLLSAKDWIINNDFPIFLIWTVRKENGKDITADMLNCNLPESVPLYMQIVIIDLMCARGVSSGETLKHIKAHNIPEKNITFLFGVSAPEGLIYLRDNFPEVKIITAYTGDHIGLDERNYIIYKDSKKMVVGDAGDRWMGISGKGKLMNNNKKGG